MGLSKKLNNKRRFPGEHGPRPDLVSFRRKEAQERQEAFAALTPEAKLQLLDARLGKGVGAKKQRAKLNALVNAKQ